MKIKLPGSYALTKNGKNVSSYLSNVITKITIFVEF